VLWRTGGHALAERLLGPGVVLLMALQPDGLFVRFSGAEPDFLVLPWISVA
jgi:hypothetical protein